MVLQSICYFNRRVIGHDIRPFSRIPGVDTIALANNTSGSKDGTSVPSVPSGHFGTNPCQSFHPTLQVLGSVPNTPPAYRRKCLPNQENIPSPSIRTVIAIHPIRLLAKGFRPLPAYWYPPVLGSIHQNVMQDHAQVHITSLQCHQEESGDEYHSTPTATVNQLGEQGRARIVECLPLI